MIFWEIFNEKSNISSREIALLTRKSHEQVLKDCENLNITYSKMGYPKISSMIYYEDDNTNTPLHEYVLTKLQYFDLMTGYDPKLFVEILFRIQELENQQQAHQIFDGFRELVKYYGKVTNDTVTKVLSQHCTPQERSSIVNAAKIILEEENEKEKLMSN